MRLDFWPVVTLGIDLPVKLVYLQTAIFRYRHHN